MSSRLSFLPAVKFYPKTKIRNVIFTGMLEKAVFYAEYQSIAAQGHSGLFSLSIFVCFNDVEVNLCIHLITKCFILNLAVNIYRQCKYLHVHRIMMGWLLFLHSCFVLHLYKHVVFVHKLLWTLMLNFSNF